MISPNLIPSSGVQREHVIESGRDVHYALDHEGGDLKRYPVIVQHAGVKDPCGLEGRYVCKVCLVDILVTLVSRIVTVVRPVDITNLCKCFAIRQCKR